MLTCWVQLDVDINKSHGDMDKSHVDMDKLHVKTKKVTYSVCHRSCIDLYPVLILEKKEKKIRLSCVNAEDKLANVPPLLTAHALITR